MTSYKPGQLFFKLKKKRKLNEFHCETSRSELVGYLMDFRESFNIWEMGQDDRREFVGQSILYDDRTETPLINHSTKFQKFQKFRREKKKKTNFEISIRSPKVKTAREM